MSEERLLKMMKGEDILIHLKCGKTLCGAYLGNYDRMQRGFEFENHRTNTIEKIRLDEIESLVQ